jgi:hypothetical protein
MEVSGHLYAPAALFPEKQSWVSIKQEAGWVPDSLDMVTKRKIPFSAGNQTLSVQYIQLLY